MAGKKYAPELVDAGFAVEVADAPLMHTQLGIADLAHVLCLMERGVIPREGGRRLVGALLEAYRIPWQEFPYDPVHGEVYNCRERWLAERIGRDAGWLHAGRPRREAVRIAVRLRVRRDVVDLIEAAAQFVLAAAAQAEAHAETFMAEQTYLQHAQPSTFGHYLVAFTHAVLREIDRLTDELAWVNRSPAGAGGVNGSRLTGADRAKVSALMCFDDVIEHTRDAMWQADGYLALMSTTASLVTTLAKLAEDLEIWASSEFDYVSLADGHTRTSVLMPQKRNPYALTMVRGEAGVLIGRMAGMYAVSKSPSARSDNLIFAYGEVPRSVELAVRATRLMAGVTAGLTVNAERAYEALESGFSQAADLAEHLMVTNGLDYRSAYEVVGAAVRKAAAAGLPGVDLTEALDPAAIVRSRAMRGGAEPGVVREMARSAARAGELALDRARGRRNSFDEVEADLIATAEGVAGQ